MVGGAAVPAAEALAGRTGEGTGWVVGVQEGEEIGRQGASVGLLETGKGEGTRNEFARVWRGGGRWLVRMERATVVSRRAVLVSVVLSVCVVIVFG